MEYKDKQILSVKDFCESNIIDDTKRSEGLTTPPDVKRYDNIFYGPDKEVNFLDVYLPKNTKRKIPVIVSIHGGGWVYGNKDIMQFYCMSLAQHGFAVINFSYRLAPKYKHPTPFIDTNCVFHWVFNNASKYHFDTKNIFAVGDSVGANILSLYCLACCDPTFAQSLQIETPPGFLPSAIGLNCGIYHMKRGEVDALLDSFADEYFPNKGLVSEYEDTCVINHLHSTFPPSFIVTAEGDFLANQAKPFYECLKGINAETEYRYYGDHDHPLKHVFHIDIKLLEARNCNEEECNFFIKHITK